MKYLSLDIETTGLRPKVDQVLQIAMVVEDTANIVPVEELPKFVAFIKNPEYVGQPYALGLNGWIFDIISGRNKITPHPILEPEAVIDFVNIFLNQHFGFMKKATVAGKNVAGFDIPFLPTEISSRFKHRVIDAGSVFMDWSKDTPPSLGDLTGGVIAHDAYEDALDVIRVLRRAYVK